MEKNSEQNKKRIDSVDIAKGLGMFLVIWGHIMRGDITNRYIYAFHIPLFFFLSGMMFSNGKYPRFKEFLLNKVKTLLIPYLIYSFATWIIWASFSYFSKTPVESYWMPLLQTFIAQGSAGFLIHNGVLWFVTCLFVVEILYWCIDKIPQVIVRLLICVLCAVIGCSMVTYKGGFDFTLLPWNFEVALMVIVFYALGNICKTQIGIISIESWISRNKIITFLTIIICSVIVYYIVLKTGKISMGHANPGKVPVLFYVNAIVGIIMMLLLSMFFAVSKLNNSRVLNFTKWIGRNSYCVMAIHNPIKGVLVLFVAKIASGHITNQYLLATVSLCLTVLVTSLGVILINSLSKRIKSRKEVK